MRRVAAAYAQNAKAYLEQAITTLQPLATSGPGEGISESDLEVLQEDLDTAFWDVSRVHQEAALEHVFSVAHAVTNAWQSNRLQDPVALNALTDLLFTLRQAADAALSDARSFMAYQGGAGPEQPPPGVDAKRWHEAENRLRQAAQAYEVALAQIDHGNTQAAGQHLLQAWQRATDALQQLGYTLVPGEVTDLDGDGVADQLEVRFGASPLFRDTDGDGLGDAFEIMKAAGNLWPSRPTAMVTAFPTVMKTSTGTS